MALPKRYQTMEEFTREELRTERRIGWSLEDLEADMRLGRRAYEESEEPEELSFE
ncbi:MAG: hypothetical protein AB7S26_19475 [Sandaracinaceae bacterium]